MGFLTELWLPILLSGVAVFIVSSIMHMAIPIHKNDLRKLESEDAVMDSLRTISVAPGEYMFPSCHDMQKGDMDAFKAKWEKGPVGYLTVMPPGSFTMGKCLGQWFAYTLVVGLFVAYIAWQGLRPGAEYLTVFQMTGATAFLVYGIGSVPGSIWKGVSWVTTGKFIFDGLLYALATAGVFGWLWPAIEAAAPAGLPGATG